jgi:hypothetical protein
MTMATLAEYIKSKREDRRTLNSNATKLRDEWLEQLDDLMADIRGWLKPAAKEGLKVNSMPVEITEQGLGTYTAPGLLIEFEASRVAIEPIARIIVGGHGRVDIRGDQVTFSLIFTKPERSWYVVRDRDWSSREPLSEKVFERLMEAIL